MNIRALFIATLFASMPIYSHGATNTNKTNKTFGNWSVEKYTNNMTDEVKCTAFLKTNRNVQMTNNTLYVRVQGGVEGYQVRFGNMVAEPIRLPDDETDARLGLVALHSFIGKALETQRIRLSIIRTIGDPVELDLNTKGITESMSFIRNECPE